MRFGAPDLFHPAAYVLSWLVLLVAIQVLSWPVLLLMGAAITLAGGAVRQRWRCLLRRARWLLLTLGIVLAYGSPGDALFDVAWLPTEVGIADAGLHVLRLVIMLGSLAWLFVRLSREDLLAGLWALAAPLRRLGCDVGRAVVRLSLVFDIVQETPKPGNWRQLLEGRPAEAGNVATVRIALPRWRALDSALVVLLPLAILVAWWLP